MLWIQHSRWCRCSVRSKRRVRAESECACQEEPKEVWNLALSFNCPVISRDVWGSWPGRAGLWGTGDQSWCRDCKGLKWSRVPRAEWVVLGRQKWDLTGTGTTGSAALLHPWNQCPLSPSWQMVKKTLKSHGNDHCRDSRIHLITAPQHTQFSHLWTL